MKFGEPEKAKRNLIQYQHIKTHRTAKDDGELAPDYQQLMELLNEQRTAPGEAKPRAGRKLIMRNKSLKILLGFLVCFIALLAGTRKLTAMTV